MPSTRSVPLPPLRPMVKVPLPSVAVASEPALIVYCPMPPASEPIRTVLSDMTVPPVWITVPLLSSPMNNSAAFELVRSSTRPSDRTRINPVPPARPMIQVVVRFDGRRVGGPDAVADVQLASCARIANCRLPELGASESAARTQARRRSRL